jgi:hypothetical protein
MSLVSQLPYSGFDPRSVARCEMWMDAADISTFVPANPTNGSTITQWSDKSGKSQHATGVTGALPTYATNSQNVLPCVSFVGTKRFTFPSTGTFPMGTSPFSVFIAGRAGTSGSSQTFMAWGNGTNGRPQYFVATNGTVLSYGLLGATSSTTPITVDSFNVFSSLHTTAVTQPYKTGTAFTSITHTAYNILTGATSYIGDSGAASRPLNGTIGEIIVYSEYLTSSQRQQVEGYLAWKWGVRTDFPTGHIFRSNPIASRPFQPPDVGALSLWLDAADQSTLTLSSTNVTAWRDKSSNAYSFTGAVGAYPTYSNTLNGLPVVSSATNQRLSNASWSTPSATATMFLVMRPTQQLPNNGSYILTNYGSGQVGFTTYLSYADQVNYYYYFQMFGAQTTSSGAFLFQSSLSNSSGFNPTNLPLLITANIVGGSHYVRYNGTQTAGNVLLDGRSIVASSGVTLFVAGDSAGGSYGYDLAEMIMYDGNLSVEQMRRVEGYLATKWRISANIPTNEPYYNLRTLPDTTLFSPVNLSNCALWLDGYDPARDGVTPAVGASVTSWLDKSGSNANGTLIGTAPTYASGGGILFAGNGAYGTPYSASLTNETVFVAFRYTRSSPTDGQSLIGQTGDGARLLSIVGDATLTSPIASSVYNVAVGAISPTNVVPYNVVGIGSIRTMNSNMAVFYNGVSYGTPTTVTITSGRTSVIGGAYNGGSIRSSQYFGGTIFEVIGYNRALSTIERQQVEGYLAWKWGSQIRLASTHPYSKLRT